MSQPRIIVPGQQQAPPPGQVAYGANGEALALAIQYENIGGLQTLMTIEQANEFVDRFKLEIGKAEETRLRNRIAAHEVLKVTA